MEQAQQLNELPRRHTSGLHQVRDEEWLRPVQIVERECAMNKVMMIISAVGALTAFSAPSSAAQRLPTGDETVCAYQRCVPTTERQYDQCSNLAVQRGWNGANNHDRGRNWFIYQCLRGEVPR
jgi:hypothetical protein